jgi:hypothetical protein
VDEPGRSVELSCSTPSAVVSDGEVTVTASISFSVVKAASPSLAVPSVVSSTDANVKSGVKSVSISNVGETSPQS